MQNDKKIIDKRTVEHYTWGDKCASEEILLPAKPAHDLKGLE